MSNDKLKPEQIDPFDVMRSKLKSFPDPTQKVVLEEIIDWIESFSGAVQNILDKVSEFEREPEGKGKPTK